ncbi:hypothetical protein Y024_5790 [Burkholderia pseudomallei TSV44]|nr:hypothetical protein Y024_5790 [Burkholderia pseudomallei TSV44]
MWRRACACRRGEWKVLCLVAFDLVLGLIFLGRFRGIWLPTNVGCERGLSSDL